MVASGPGCADIAIDAAPWQSKGKSTAEVCLLADEKFDDVGPVTNTPPVVQ